MAGVRAGLNGIDVSQMENSLMYTPESETHPAGVERVESIDAGVRFAQQYYAEYNYGYISGFAGCCCDGTFCCQPGGYGTDVPGKEQKGQADLPVPGGSPGDLHGLCGLPDYVGQFPGADRTGRCHGACRHRCGGAGAAEQGKRKEVPALSDSRIRIPGHRHVQYLYVNTVAVRDLEQSNSRTFIIFENKPDGGYQDCRDDIIVSFSCSQVHVMLY